MAKLILCADDYAQSPAINAAILALISQGVVTATSCMTLSPEWPASARALDQSIRHRADIGLHLDFTQFAQACRLPHSQLVLASLLRLLDSVRVSVNIAQQLDAFEQAMGTAPDYIDGHLHVHQLPVIRTALLQALQQRYGALPQEKRPWLRISSPPAGSGCKARLIHWLGARALSDQARQAGFQVSPCLLGVYDFRGDGVTYQAHWQDWASQLSRLALGTDDLPPVLMCHPGQATASPEADPIAAARVVEWEHMRAPAFRQWLTSAGLEPVKGRACVS